MSNPLVPPQVAKTAEGNYLKLEANEPQKFILYKPVEIIEAEDGDNLKFFRKVNIEGVEKHIKYKINLREVMTGDIKEWTVGSASAVNQLMTIKAEVGDIIEIEKIQTGSRPQDIRYRLKMVEKGTGGQKTSDPATEQPEDDGFDPEDIPQ